MSTLPSDNREAEKDRQAWQRVYGHVEPGDPQLERYTADDYSPPADNAKGLSGEAAAAAGRELMEFFAGGAENLQRARSGRGRPSLGAAHANGESEKVVMRVGKDLRDSLDSIAAVMGITRSELMRNVLGAFVRTRRAI